MIDHNNMKNHRISLLIKMLSKYQHPISSAMICEELKIKPRTLRDDIARSKDDLLLNGIEILSKHGVGYQLSILDEDKYYAFIKSLLKKEQQRHFVLPVDTDERVNYLIRTFLSSDEYLKLDDVADDIFISRSTLNNYLKLVREELAQFNLELSSKPAYGVKISGTELDLRRAIARYFFYDDTKQHLFSNSNESEARKIIREILISVLSNQPIKLTDLGFQNLIIHLEIALMRITKSDYDVNVSEEYQTLEDKVEFNVAKELASKLEQQFNLKIPKQELYFITIHLMGKRSFNQDNSFVITPEIEALFNQIFKRIREVFNVNLMDDFELYTLLALHFRPMLDRLAYGLNIHNPILDQIKEENVKAFDMALLAGQVIKQETALDVNEAEIGYMAIHFALALERQKEITRKHKIIVVCASGMGSSQLLLHRIKQRFSHYIESIKIVQLYELKEFNQKEYDFIISTVDIPFKTEIKILKIHYFLDNQDVVHMEHYLKQSSPDDDLIDKFFSEELFFTDLTSQDRFGLISELCDRISEFINLEEGFTDLVIEREKLSATEFGNQIAFPHPIHHSGQQTFVSVAILAQPIKWEKQWVRYVFMLNVGQNESESLQLLYESLITLMSDSSRLKQLDEHKDFQTLARLLQSTLESAKQDNQESAFK